MSKIMMMIGLLLCMILLIAVVDSKCSSRSSSSSSSSSGSSGSSGNINNIISIKDNDFKKLTSSSSSSSDNSVKLDKNRINNNNNNNNNSDKICILAKKVIIEEPKLNAFCKKDKTGKLVLNYYGLMVAGAIARATAATAVHPLSVIKTMLQMKNGKIPPLTWNVLSRGAGSQFIMSVPHGAVNFAITETTKTALASIATNSTISNFMTTIIPKKIFNNVLDFLSSAVSTFICSIISTPQMVLTDRIMGGVYENFFDACYKIAKDEGIRGFYLGWLPALMQKIPSYALTWMFFQQLKQSFLIFVGRVGTTFENTLLGSAAAAFACCVMIPIDTVKTRIVMSQRGGGSLGVFETLSNILQGEGIFALYKALPPRLLSVVPMIGIQFGVYELMKRVLMGQSLNVKTSVLKKVIKSEKVKSK